MLAQERYEQTQASPPSPAAAQPDRAAAQERYEQTQASPPTKGQRLTVEEQNRICDEIYRNLATRDKRRALNGLVVGSVSVLFIVGLIALGAILGAAGVESPKFVDRMAAVGLLIAFAGIIRGGWTVLVAPRTSWEVICDVWRNRGFGRTNADDEATNKEESQNGE